MLKKCKIRINKNDIVGKQVGKLVVLEYAFAKHTYGKKNCKKLRHFYLCECECGVKKFIQRGPLLNNIVKTCGCSRFRSDSNKKKANLAAPIYLPVNPDFDKSNWIFEQSKEVHCAAIGCFYNLDSVCDCKKPNINPGLAEECPQFLQD